MKLKCIETICTYLADDGEQYRSKYSLGSNHRLSSWQRLEYSDDGKPFWSYKIPSDTMDRLDKAAELELLERNSQGVP
jgi:hypothetical protein